MRRNIEHESLIEILDYLKMPMLPHPNIESKIWTKAIVKVQSMDGSVGYIYATHDFYAIDELKIEKSCGCLGIYHSTLGIYPLEYLDTAVVPIIKDKDDIINFLLPRCNEEKEHLESMKMPALRMLFYNVCIKEQLHYSANGVRMYTDNLVLSVPVSNKTKMNEPKPAEKVPVAKTEEISLTKISEETKDEEF